MSTLTIEPLDGLESTAGNLAADLAGPAPELQPAESTSSLERYLAEVTDPVLRENLAREIGSLQRQFGLVFERHHPEGIRLPRHKVKRGSKVVIAGRKDSVFYRVQRLHRDQSTALIVDAQGNEQIISINELTVAKEFGDIMYPGLRKLSEVRRGPANAQVHTIINGENYHALEMLQYTHSGKVDLIYIDPPYNTGAADWKYNDRYVDAKDGYRHSKWLSFMEKRLEIAKRILKPSGVVVMAIDDNEHHRLRLLADQVFGEQNFLVNLTWQGNSKNGARFTGGGVDYMLAYARSREELVASGVIWREKKPGIDRVFDAARIAWEQADGEVSKANKLFRAAVRKFKSELDPGAYRYDSLDENGRIYLGDNLSAPDKPETRSHRPLIHPVTGLPCAVSPRGWAASDTKMDQWLAEGRILFGRDHTTLPTYKRYLEEQIETNPYPTFTQPRRPAAEHLFKVMGDKRFPFPKDHEVLMRWFRMVAPKDAVILDFFGGSGTTAEAVICLNAEDGGTRQCILVTNNELSKADDTRLRRADYQPGDDEYEAFGVFHHVTKPRLETVVTGVREDGSKYSAGLDANVAFFELTYLDEPEILTGRALEDMAGLFWLKAGGTGSILEASPEARRDGFALSDSGRTAVLLTPGRAAELAERIRTSGDQITHLFIVTDSAAQGDEAASHFPSGIAVERIYGNYLEAFQVNRKD